MSSTSSGIEVYVTPPSSPPSRQLFKISCQTPDAPTSLDLDFNTAAFDLPRIVIGICCSAREVWYSNCHWPEDPRFENLFLQAAETQNKLEPEFSAIWNSQKRKSLATMPYTFELRMAGVRLPGRQQIKLRPTVWIRTTDEAVRKKSVWRKLKKKIEELGLNSPQYAAIYVEGGLRLANSAASVPKENLPLENGIKFPNDVTSFLHISKDPENLSICGRVCLVTMITEDKIVYQQASRIGGLVRCNDTSNLGTTSGHVILNYFLERARLGATSEGGSGSYSHDELLASSDRLDAGLDSGLSDQAYTSGEESDDEIELVENNRYFDSSLSDHGQFDLTKVTSWVSVTPYDTISFVNRVELDMTQNLPIVVDSSSQSIPADFSLISGLSYWRRENCYLSPIGYRWVSDIIDDDSLLTTERGVLILLDQESTVSGTLLCTAISLKMCGITIPCRKVRLHRPLSPGTSGTWVVEEDSGALCGTIIAVFNQESYALMFTAQTLLSDIERYSKHIQSVMVAPRSSLPSMEARPSTPVIQSSLSSYAPSKATTDPEVIESKHGANEISMAFKSPLVDSQVGATGVGMEAFGGLLGAFTACARLYGLWKSFRGLDGYLGLLRTKLILQEALLDQWRRDWLDLPTPRPPGLQKQRILQRHQDAVLASLLTVRTLLETLEPLRKASSSEHALERLRLAAGGALDHDKTLMQISSVLSDLYRLLPTRDPNMAVSQTVLSLEHIDNGSQFLLEDSNSTQHVLGAETLKKVISFRRLGYDLDKDLEERVSAPNKTTLGSDLIIRSGRVKVTKDDEGSGGLRSFGTIDSGTPVIIEWKRYDLTWKGQRGIRLRGRIQNIARLLHADSKPEELLTLNCLGVYEEYEKSRYGLVFEYPLDVGGQGHMLSLQSLMKSPTPETLPTLGDRYRMAYALTLSLAILHASGWLHKSIRSHNIMFPIRHKRPIWSRPYLVSFDFSRPDSSDSITEKPEQTVRFNLYRHPSAQGIPSEFYGKGFDIYSLGVVLVEVGLWRLAWSLRSGAENPAKFREVIISKVNDRLAHFMGKGYQEAALSCLNGDLDQRDGSVIRAFYNEVVQTMCSLAESQL